MYIPRGSSSVHPSRPSSALERGLCDEWHRCIADRGCADGPTPYQAFPLWSAVNGIGGGEGEERGREVRVGVSGGCEGWREDSEHNTHVCTYLHTYVGHWTHIIQLLEHMIIYPAVTVSCAACLHGN